MIRYFVIIALLGSTILQADWKEKVATCPVCLQQTVFLQPASFSNEIYMRPSRFQYVFWPFTDTRSIYCCQTCSYSTYSWHFMILPANKLDAVEAELKKLAFAVKHYQNYTKIPASIRLEIAERIYKIWGIFDDNGWCEFYRTKAYHLEQEEKTTKEKRQTFERKNPTTLSPRKHPGVVKSLLGAIFYPVLKFMISNQTKDFVKNHQHRKMNKEQGTLQQKVTEARQKALQIAEKVLEGEEQDTLPRKECYYIAGSMSYLLKDYKKAKVYFSEGLKIDYKTTQMKKEEAEEYSKYLNKLLQDYLKKLENRK